MLSYNWAMVWNSISDGDDAGYSCPSGMMEKLQELIFFIPCPGSGQENLVAEIGRR